MGVKGLLIGKLSPPSLKVKMGSDLILVLQLGLILDRFHLRVICFDFDFHLGFPGVLTWESLGLLPSLDLEVALAWVVI